MRQTSTLGVARFFTAPKTKAYDSLKWVKRDSVIKNPMTGKPVFEQKNVEFAEGWSLNAINIVAQKYFTGTPGILQISHPLPVLLLPFYMALRHPAPVERVVRRCFVFAGEVGQQIDAVAGIGGIGRGSGGGVALEELGAIMNLTRERIRQLETRGLAKLKALGEMASLSDYCND